jgi:hypothetical protein
VHHKKTFIDFMQPIAASIDHFVELAKQQKIKTKVNKGVKFHNSPFWVRVRLSQPGQKEKIAGRLQIYRETP